MPAALCLRIQNGRTVVEPQSRRWHRWYAAMMFSAAVLPVIPDELSWELVLFLCCTVFFVLFSLRRTVRVSRYLARPVPLCIGAFLCVAATSWMVAEANETPFLLWVRGIVPFIPLSVYFLIVPLASVSDYLAMLKTVWMASVVWLCKVLFICAANWDRILNGEASRLTYLSLDLLSPFPLIGLVLTLYVFRQVRFRAILLLAFAGVIIWCGYRSHGILAAVSWIFYLITERRTRELAMIVLGVGVGAVCYYAFAETSFWSAHVGRYQRLHEETRGTRYNEVRFALDRFAASPAVGQGLGFPVPLDIVSGNLGSRVVGVSTFSVGYIHNVWAYLLMTLGVAGFLPYCGAILASALPAIRDWWWDRRSYYLLGSLVATFNLLAFFTISASYRHVQCNLLLAALLAVLGGRIRQQRAYRTNAAAFARLAASLPRTASTPFTLTTRNT